MTDDQPLAKELPSDYARYEGRMEHEDMLISQRVSWLLTAQAFLLSPYVLLHNNHAVSLLEYVVVAIGLLSTLLTYMSVAAGIHAMLRLKFAYDAYVSQCEPMRAFKPVVDLSRIETRHGLIAPRGLIYCYLTAWITLLFVSLKSHHMLPLTTWNETAGIGIACGMGVSAITFLLDRTQTGRVERECII